MSASTVRNAVTAYLGNTTGITTFYRDQPWFADAEEWETQNGDPGTVAYMHIDDESEERIVINGGTATGKQVTYQIAVVMLYQYAIPDQPLSKDSWVDGLDALIEALKTKIRTDPTLGTGTGGVVWQAGSVGGKDIEIQRELPKLKDGLVLSWNALTFRVTEML